jgi:ankyrin repeat protein
MKRRKAKKQQPLNKKLLVASSKLDLAGIKTALAQGADAGAVDGDGNTALMLVCGQAFKPGKSVSASRDIALELLAQGIDVNAVDNTGNTVLTLVCEQGFRTGENASASRDVVLELLAQGADVNAVGSSGLTVLGGLCGYGFRTDETVSASQDVALELLAQGADANAVDNTGNSVLTLVCGYGFRTRESVSASREVVLQLLAQGADVNAVDRIGYTALMWVCSRGFRTAEGALVSREVVLQLLAQGADPRVVSSSGNTALILLCAGGAEGASVSRDVAFQLLAQGADPRAVASTTGYTALTWLCAKGFKTAESAEASRDIVFQLLAQGADVNTMTDNGNVALMWLCSWGFRIPENGSASREVVLQLLAQGADPNAVAKSGSTALLAIAQWGEGLAATDVVRHLILKGAKVTHEKHGVTAKNQAQRKGKIEMETLLADAQRGIMPQLIPNANRIRINENEHDSKLIAEHASFAMSSEYLPAPSALQGLATAQHAYTAETSDQLSLASGETLTVLEKFDTGWWRCQHGTLTGLVPSSCLQMIKSTSCANYHSPLASSSSAAASTSTLHGDNSGLNVLGQVTASLTIEHQELSFDRKLGEGSFAEVFQGTWRQMDVAIKRLHVKQMSAAALADFKNSAAIMVQLCSPHTMTLFGITLLPEYTMVMEYMPRGALYDVLHSDESLPWSTRQQIALDMSFGLSLLHQEHMLHRDLTSMKVLLDNHYHAKLADFGFSKIKQESNVTPAKGQRVDALAWKAPELFTDGCEYTPECDIYSLGMTLWELVSRKLPFADANGEISTRVLQGEQETIPADTPEEIKAVIQACWSSQAEQRPSASKVVALLKANALMRSPQHPSVSQAHEDTVHSPEAGSSGQAAPAPSCQFHSERSPGRSRPDFFSSGGRISYQMSDNATELADGKNGGVPRAMGGHH